MGGLLVAGLFVLVFIFVIPTAAIYRTVKMKRRLDALEQRVAVMKRQLDAQAEAAFRIDDEEAVRSEGSENIKDDAPAPTPEIDQDDEEDASFEDTKAENGASGPAEAGPPPPQSSYEFPRFTMPKNLEQALGAQWATWVGGIAMALGAIFLVRYAADQGYFGPSARIALGALLACILAFLGERLRRQDPEPSLAGYSSAYLPGVLTGTGIVAAFATIYSAYALYDFLSPVSAFILLAAVSFLSLLASWLHGPRMAALGLVGSFVTPALVSSEAPSAWTLFTYLLLVAAAAYALANLKNWIWIARAGAIGSVVWGLIWLYGHWSSGDLTPFAVYVVGLLSLAFYALGYTQEPSDVPARYDLALSGILAATSFLAFPILRLEYYSSGSISILALVSALLFAFAWTRPQLSRLVPWIAILFGFAYLAWHIPSFALSEISDNDVEMGLVPIAAPGLWQHLVTGFWFAAGIGAISFVGGLEHKNYRDWFLTAGAAPVTILAYAFWRASDFDHLVPFGLIALGLATHYLIATEYLFRRNDDGPWRWASGIMAAAGVAALALAFTMTLDKGWLTISLALICAGLAFVADYRPVPGFRYLAAAFAAIVAVRLALNPVVDFDVGQTPILNWLLYGYGVPAAALAYAAYKFRKVKDDWTITLLEAASVLFVVVLISLQIRHFMNDGNVYASSFGIAEAGLQASAWLALSMGLQRLRSRLDRPVYQYGAMALAGLGLGFVIIGLLLGFNPLFTGEELTGNRFFNALIPGYFVPALLCALLYMSRRLIDDTLTINRWITGAAGVSALILLFSFLSLLVRSYYHWPVLSTGISFESEQYSYSALWLVLGVALLYFGNRFGARLLRLASLAVIGLTVCKVFLYDMAGLTGFLRALSFIGLGAALLGIGFFYQRFVFPQSTDKDPAPDTQSD